MPPARSCSAGSTSMGRARGPWGSRPGMRPRAEGVICLGRREGRARLRACRARRALDWAALVLLAVDSCTLLRPEPASAPSPLFGREVRLDRDGKLLACPLVDAPYAHVAGLAWRALETKFPVQDDGSRPGRPTRALRSGYGRGDRVASQSGRLLRHADRLRRPLVRIQRRPARRSRWPARRSPTRWPMAPPPRTGTGLASRTQARGRATWTTKAPTTPGRLLRTRGRHRRDRARQGGRARPRVPTDVRDDGRRRVPRRRARVRRRTGEARSCGRPDHLPVALPRSRGPTGCARRTRPT